MHTGEIKGIEGERKEKERKLCQFSREKLIFYWQAQACVTIKEIFNEDYEPVQCWNLKMHPRQAHKHTSFYHSSLYRTWQILCSLQTEGLWQPCVEPSFAPYVPTAFSHFTPLCHSWVTCRISIFFLPMSLYLLWSMISDFLILLLYCFGEST